VSQRGSVSAHAEAFEAALRESVATKSDIAEVKSDIADVRDAIELSVRDMTIRMGAIALFVALATIKFFPYTRAVAWALN
jgi:uncharacterized protein YfcZ (UPF0381/DUF406 family)